MTDVAHRAWADHEWQVIYTRRTERRGPGLPVVREWLCRGCRRRRLESAYLIPRRF